MTTSLNVKIFADGANKKDMLDLYAMPEVKGFTTNPTLMRRAGITDYVAFAKDILREIPDRPISFEVFSDDLAEMESQALEIGSWGKNVFVKVPVTNTQGKPTYDVVARLAEQKVQVNVTALMTLAQVRDVSAAVGNHAPSNISVFAGRVADTGIDPVPVMTAAVSMMSVYDKQQLIWASPREVLNIVQASDIGCHIITVTPGILKKLHLLDHDLTEFSLETVKMFRADALAAGFTL